MLMRLITAFFFLLTAGSAFAGGRGGHSTTWDPNSADWSCLGPQIAGCNRGFDAQCAGGSTNDQTALAAANSYGLSQNPALVSFYIAPGSGVNRVCQLGTPGDSLTFGIQNAQVWAYGVSIARINTLSGFTYFDGDAACATTCSFIQTVSTGSCTLTPITSGEVANYSVDDWLQVGDLAQAVSGNPMTVTVSEAVVITAKSASTLTIAPCLTNSYKSTYPVPGATPDKFQGGPAQIWKLQPSWSANTRWFGPTILDGQTVLSGRSITCTDCIFNLPPGGEDTPAPSGPGRINLIFGFSPSMEIDKNIGFLGAYRHSIRNARSASAGNNIQFDSSTISALVGTSTNTVLNDTQVGFAFIGPTNGAGGNLTLNNSTISSLRCSNTGATLSALSYSNGRFTIARSAAPAAQVYAAFTPGGSNYFADNDGSDDASPSTQFTVFDMSQDATNTFIDTTNWKQNGSPISTPVTLPSVTCNGHACLLYTARQVNTLVSKFSTAPGLSACVATP